jgi:hypothetical protein
MWQFWHLSAATTLGDIQASLYPFSPGIGEFIGLPSSTIEKKQVSPVENL